ncbi:hypothetical protein EFR00_16220 [Rhizobium sophoriradicis]|nr:hypothetical protein EFR00_16220 [Rhizobium sophoriradicis]
MRYLSSVGPNIKIGWREVKDCGPETEERLKASGFLETFPQEKFPDQIGYYMLTQAGLDTWQKQSAREQRS